jgi:hypothetical protein
MMMKKSQGQQLWLFLWRTLAPVFGPVEMEE